MSEEDTLYSVLQGVATITLNREGAKNALSVGLMNSLGDNLQRAESDDSVRAIVLTNTGNTFCAGADLKGDMTVVGPRPEMAFVVETYTPMQRQRLKAQDHAVTQSVF